MDAFVRAKDNGAIINTNAKELYAIKKKREEAKQAKETIKRLDTLENEVRELKELIRGLTKGTVDV